MKWFCPWCGLELESNRAGASHIYPHSAWEGYGCEYQVGDFLAKQEKNYPVSELEREKRELKLMEKNRTHLTRSINKQRIQVENLEKEWEQISNGNKNKNQR